MGGVAGGQVTDTLPDWLQASLDADPTLGQVGVVADWLDEHGHPLAPGWRWLWANGRVPWGYGRAYLWSDWTKDAEDLSELPGTVLDLFIVKATVLHTNPRDTRCGGTTISLPPTPTPLAPSLRAVS
jgi:hypothetical protein